MLGRDDEFKTRVLALKDELGVHQAKRAVRRDLLLETLAIAEYEKTQDAIESLRLVLIDLVENMNV